MFTADQVWGAAVAADRINGGYLKEPVYARNLDVIEKQANKQMVKDWGVNGVYFNIIRNCDPHGYEIPELRDYFEQMNLPVLVVEQDYATTALESLRTRFQAFAESIG